jgi:predicted DNA-binding ribbon-helix-helix protein
MDRVISYKGFHIRAFEQTQGCWLAEIRRATGGWIIVRSSGERREVLTTSALRGTAGDAIDFAIEAIDGGGMK